MKRNRTTLAAAALAGALAVAVAPAAQAQDYPAVTTDARGHEYFLNNEGTHYLPNEELAQTAFDALTSEDREKAVDVTRAAMAGLIGAGEAVAPSNAEAAGANAADTTQEVQQEEVFGPEHVDATSDQPVAAGLVALPPVLTIGETTYYLNADGQTYVTDVARVQETPNEQEVAASQELLAANGAEVARQAIEAARAAGESVDYSAQVPAEAGTEQAEAEQAGEAAAPQDPAPVADPAAERGIAAETGNNTVSKALFALVIASVVGAAAFAYGRRFLV